MARMDIFNGAARGVGCSIYRTFTKILLGLGLDELSMSAVSIPRIKETIRFMSYKEARKLAEKVLNCTERAEIEKIIREDQLSS